MKDDRKRQPVKDNYALALGGAAYCFALCEWNAVWCCERIEPGRLTKIVGNELTAGAIAKVLFDLARNMPPSPQREELKRAAEKFLRVVELRNSIFHAKPCTDPSSGNAQLSAGEKILQVSDLDAAADSFSECSIELNGLLHGFLKTYKPRQRQRRTSA